MWISGGGGIQTQTANLRAHILVASKEYPIISTLGGKKGQWFPVMKQLVKIKMEDHYIKQYLEMGVDTQEYLSKEVTQTRAAYIGQHNCLINVSI